MQFREDMSITYPHNAWRGNTVWDIVWKLHVTHYVNTYNVWREEYSVEHNEEITYNEEEAQCEI